MSTQEPTAVEKACNRRHARGGMFRAGLCDLGHRSPLLRGSDVPPSQLSGHQLKYLLERVWCHPGHIKCPIFSLRQRETFCLLMPWIKCPKLSQNVIWPLTIHDFNSRCKARCRQNSEWDVANAFTSIMKQVVLLARYCTMHLSFERTCPWSRCPCFLQGKMQGPSQFFGRAHTASKWWRQGSKPGSVSLQNLFPTLL